MTEAVVAGRIGIDLYPNQLETPLRAVRTYTRYVGGFAGNVATGLARLGVRTAIVSRVGDDGHGEFVRDFLDAEGVDTRFLAVDPVWPTPPTFCEIWPPDRFPITFYRRPTAPDWHIVPGDVDAAEIAAAPVLYTTGTGLAQSPSRETTLALMTAHGGTTILDLDWRSSLWDDPAAYADAVQEASSVADVLVGNTEEVAAAGGIDLVLTLAPVLVLKRGGHGAVLYADGEIADVPGIPVDVVNGLGAGDAFAAALGYALVRGLGLLEGVRLGNAAGAHVAQRMACSESMPTLEELTAVEVS
ncbi:MAG: PfkB family carbohydrate kinase [Gaiellaceae bacterium]